MLFGRAPTSHGNSQHQEPIKVFAPVHSVNEAAVGSDDYAVDSVDESVGSEVGSAIDVVDILVVVL